MRKILILLITVFLAFISVNSFSAEAIKDPDPVPIPAGLTHEDIVKAIEVGMQKRGWQPTRKDDNRIIATLSTRGGKHVVQVLIEFDEKTVIFSYLDSVNMNYSIGVPESMSPWGSDGSGKEVPVIHRKYNSWVLNLANDIRDKLSMVKLSD